MDLAYIVVAVIFAVVFAVFNSDMDYLILGACMIGVGAIWPFIILCVVVGCLGYAIARLVSILVEKAKELAHRFGVSDFLISAIAYPLFLIMRITSEEK